MPKYQTRIQRHPWTLAEKLGFARIFVFGRPRYKDYYPHTEPMRLPADPRARRRAHGKGFFMALPVWPIGWTISNLVEAHAFNFDPILQGTQWILNPFAAIFWAADLLPRHYRTVAYQQWIYHNLMIGVWGFLITMVVFNVLRGMITSANLYDTSDLTEEHGSARWAYPEELVVAGLTPPNYSIFTGFKSSERARIKRDVKALRQYNTGMRHAQKAAEAQSRAVERAPVVSVAENLQPTHAPPDTTEPPTPAASSIDIPSILGGTA